jgi:hypothetical protein
LGTNSYITEEEEEDEEETEDEEEGEQGEDDEEGVGDEEMEPVLMRKRPRLVPTDVRIPGGVATEGKAGSSGLLGLYNIPFVFEVVITIKDPDFNAVHVGQQEKFNRPSKM